MNAIILYTCTCTTCYAALKSLQDQLDTVTKERDDARAMLKGEHIIG